MVGQRVGPYHVIAKLGEGGMGEVYRARDVRLNRDVAIKRLLRHHDRFEREARAIAAINHPHICQIYDIGPDYLVLEYVDGRPLPSPLPVAEAVRLAIQIAGAVEEAHRKGVLHRDLKPSNILLTESRDGSANAPTVKLLDFGLAQIVSSDPDETRTAEGTVIGTAAYMSPEQARGMPLDERSDVFSFGAVLYEMLSGHRAFSGPSVVDVLHAVLHTEPAPLQGPRALERIVRRCLEKDPAQRFQRMSEARAALERFAIESAASARSSPEPSIAVLPFADMSPERDQEWFGDGVAEEIIGVLAHTPGLKVIARTSAFAFKGKHEDLRRIAEALGVAHLLEGSVRKAGSRIRVTAQLVAAADGRYLWSDRYDRELTDVFAVQDEIARAIAQALEVTLAADAPGQRRYAPNMAAYEAFLRGRHEMAKMTPDALGRSRALFERAIALDSRFALPHIDLGWCLLMLATENLLDPQHAAAAMRAEAIRAIEIDPSLVDAHGVMAVAAVLEYGWGEADRHFRLAMSRDPVSPWVRYFYALFYLAPLSRTVESEAQMERALQDDPLNLFFRTGLGMLRLGNGHEAAGEADLRQVLRRDPQNWIASLWLCALAVRRGRLDEAPAFAERSYAVVPENWGAIGLLAGVRDLTGDASGSEELRARFGAGEAYGAPCGLVCFHAVRSDLDAAADWFEKAVAQRDTRAPWILPRLFGNLLTSHARWPALARMMDVPLPHDPAPSPPHRSLPGV